MDFYSICAYYWGIHRYEAKNRILNWFYTEHGQNGYVQMSAKTLNYIPLEARAEALEFQGIIVGES